MDPTANLEEQLRLARRLADTNGGFDEAAAPPDPDVTRLAELVPALDEWIRQGGFLPASWAAEQHKAKARDDAQAVRELVAIIKGQLDQGVENAARHIALCLDDLGR